MVFTLQSPGQVSAEMSALLLERATDPLAICSPEGERQRDVAQQLLLAGHFGLQGRPDIVELIFGQFKESLTPEDWDKLQIADESKEKSD